MRFMKKLIYISLMRLPTEKAHGLQIMQNCEAFAQAGYQVELWVARRWNTHTMRQIQNVYAYYGVQPVFTIRRIPIVDIMPLAFGIPRLERIPFYIQIITYLVMMTLRMLVTRADVYYTRDEALAFMLGWLKPRTSLAYEAHLFSPSRRGGWLQAQVVRRCGSTIAITPKLRDDLIAQRGADPARVLVAHDGIRAARFAHLPTHAAARQHLTWDKNAFIVGFVGRLHMLNVDKGIGTLVEALAQVDNTTLALVGGPDDMAEALRARWLEMGLPDERFLYAGHVPPDDVPRYLAAFDVCAMPHPHTTQFANYTSPLKLFEYMAAGRAIVASDLPGWADVVQHEINALLVPAGDVTELAHAIQRLQSDAALRERLGAAARERAMQHYTWAARAARILQHLENNRQPRSH
jgi:glycosyltransferase involved in cell wall biosynthesis